MSEIIVNENNSELTGHKWVNFERKVQSMFSIIMLCEGSITVPYDNLHHYPTIKEIRVQTNYSGYKTDDMLMILKSNKFEEIKMLCQIKSSIKFSRNDACFKDMLEKAWKDYCNSDRFTKGRDKIVFITGLLNKTDTEDTKRILELTHKSLNDVDLRLQLSSHRQKKLDVIYNAFPSQVQNNEDKFEFLKHLVLYSYDLDIEGVFLPLIYSAIPRIIPHQQPQSVWGVICNYWAEKNSSSGFADRKELLSELKECFPDPVEVNDVLVKDVEITMPIFERDCEFNIYAFSPLLLRLFFANSWVANNENDKRIIADILMASSYNQKLDEIRDLIASNNAPIIYKKSKNGREYIYYINEIISVWKTVAPKILKEDIDVYKESFLKVFNSDKDAYSTNIRNGLATSLAVIANNKNDVQNLDAYDIKKFIEECLYDLSPWDDEMKWEDFDDVIKLFAESSPSFFLNKLEISLDNDLIELNKTINNNYLGSTIKIIINVLKMLAVESQYLDKSVALLGKLYVKYSASDGNDMIISAMANIYLPWLPHTFASLDEQISSIKMLYKEMPEACCMMLLQLMPGKITCSDSRRYSSWRNIVPDDWYDRKILMDDYIGASKKICELLLEYGSANYYVLIEIVKNIDNFTLFDDAVQFLKDQYESLIKDEKLHIWHALDEIIAKHTYHCSADWAMTKEQIDQLNLIKDLYNPDDLVEINLRLFGYKSYACVGIYDDSTSEENKVKLNGMRIFSINQILDKYGISGIETLIGKVKNVRAVGHAVANSNIEIPNNIIRSMLISDKSYNREFIMYYISCKNTIIEFTWAKTVDMTEWENEEKTFFFIALPFASRYWSWAEKELKTFSIDYWSKIWNPYFVDDDAHDYAVERLLFYKNINAAIICIWSDIEDKRAPNTNLILKALFKLTKEVRIDASYISDIVKHLQSVNDVDFDTLANIEYNFYEMLGHDVAPSSLNKRISMQPDYFIDLAKRRYGLTPYDTKNDDDWRKTWRVIDGWNIVPGTDKLGIFSEEKLEYWINDVQKKAEAENISEYTDILIGGVLIHAPIDNNGIPIAPIARFLEKNNKALRGFRTKMYNSRGTHSCSSEAELKLAEKYNRLKMAAKENGYRHLSEMYERFEEGHKEDADRYALELK